MTNNTKMWLYIALLCILVGIGIFTLTACSNGWSFASNANIKTVTHEITEDFDKIVINTDTSDITILPSEDGVCKIVSSEHKRIKTTADVKDGTLTFSTVNEKKWYDYILDFGEKSTKVYLPKSEYDSLIIKENTGDIILTDSFTFREADIKLSTGDIDCSSSFGGLLKIQLSTGETELKNCSAGKIEIVGSTGDVDIINVKSSSDISVRVTTGDVDFSRVECAGEINISVSTGDAEFYDVKCRDLVTTGDTGDFCLKRVIASEKFSIKRTTGDVEFESCDAAEILVKTSTGNVYGTLISDKSFIYSTSTGNVQLPDTAGGRCEIKTSTGNINISICEK